MNEITRIHIAKTAYDIEIAAKKQLEKYIKSLETYTQDAEVLTDIEIRITELLAERGVKAGGVISNDDVDAVRKQLGEPYEFADEEGDIAIGPESTGKPRRLYRSTDDAVLGGVLSGIAAYFNIDPIWTRLIFIVLVFASFGFLPLVYILLWIIVPPARTATEKLQLAGKDVTLESIKDLNAEDSPQTSHVATVVQKVLSIGLGTLSLISAVAVFVTTVWIVIAALTFNPQFADITNGFIGLGEGSTWIVWLLFWVVIFGLLLLTSLFGLIAYAFFKQKITKKVFISCVVIVVLGLTSFATVVGISASQSWRVANETRNMVHETKANLGKEFSNVKSVTFEIKSEKTDTQHADYFGNNATIRYTVDDGPARYELSALPDAKPSITIDGTTAKISLTIPESYRNSFVQPYLTVYGPALESITNKGADANYSGQIQDALTVTSEENSHTIVNGTYSKVTVHGSGSVDLSSIAVQTLDVQSGQYLTVTAGTVRELTVVQPDVCSSGTNKDSTSVTVSGVTSNQISYNGKMIPAKTYETSCASIIVESNSDNDEY